MTHFLGQNMTDFQQKSKKHDSFLSHESYLGQNFQVKKSKKLPGRIFFLKFTSLPAPQKSPKMAFWPLFIPSQITVRSKHQGLKKEFENVRPFFVAKIRSKFLL